jgi:hypothetical protein
LFIWTTIVSACDMGHSQSGENQEYFIHFFKIQV